MHRRFSRAGREASVCVCKQHSAVVDIVESEERASGTVEAQALQNESQHVGLLVVKAWYTKTEGQRCGMPCGQASRLNSGTPKIRLPLPRQVRKAGA